VTSYMISPSSELVVVPTIMLVHSCISSIADKSNILGHVDLFAEILDVHSQIYDHFIPRLQTLVLYQKAAGNSANDPTFELEHTLNVLVAEECFSLLKFFVTLRNLLQLFNMLLAHERIVCL